MFQHTKPIFFRLRLLTLSNLFHYFTGCFAMRVLTSKVPVTIFNRFKISDRTERLIFPKFTLSKVKDNNFVFNASKILNYLMDHAIPYHILTVAIFKKILKNHLLNIQNISINGDENWLPCNHDLFHE